MPSHSQHLLQKRFGETLSNALSIIAKAILHISGRTTLSPAELQRTLEFLEALTEALEAE